MAEYLRLHHRLLFLAKVVVIQFLCTIHRTPWYNTTVACGARCLLFASVLSGDDPSSRHADRVILRDSGFSIQTAILDCGRSCTDALYYSRSVFFSYSMCQGTSSLLQSITHRFSQKLCDVVLLHSTLVHMLGSTPLAALPNITLWLR